MPNHLIDELIRMNARASDGTEPRIYHPTRKLWLSGAPNLWSSFAERAYVFPSRACAQDLISNFPNELAGAQVLAGEQTHDEVKP